MYSVRFCYERTTPEYNITSGRNCESLATLDMYRYLGCILMLYNLTVRPYIVSASMMVLPDIGYHQHCEYYYEQKRNGNKQYIYRK